jgi:GDP/UDP-N,N'-diacetylbacillosamine 2-epimerase (hydrolysing)
MRTVCVVTGTRAEYGQLRWIMEGVRAAPDARLQVIATGMHLAEQFGLTYREIERDGFVIDRKVDMDLASDTPAGIAHSFGLAVAGIGVALAELAPDIIVLLGDRFEALAAAIAATIGRIPIAHIHGGETTIGAMDESIRHSITKMSHLHFVAAEAYRRRVIQLGEQADRVFLVGTPALDNVARLPLLDRPALEQALGLRLGTRNLLITFHPVTLEANSSERQMGELLYALEPLADTQLIFTMPNSDTDSRVLFDMIEQFVARHENAHVFTSLGQVRYLSCMRAVDGVVGNSSSGLSEAPAFGKGTVNIGDRQTGRLKAPSVIDCLPERGAIAAAIERLYSAEFQASLATVENPYGESGASDRIVKMILEHPLRSVLKKSFHDMPQ